MATPLGTNSVHTTETSTDDDLSSSDSNKENQPPTFPIEEWLPSNTNARWQGPSTVPDIVIGDIDLKKQSMDGAKLTFDAFLRFCESNDQRTALWTLFDEYHQPARNEALKSLLELFWGAIGGIRDGRSLSRSLQFTKKCLERLGIDAKEYTALLGYQNVPRITRAFADYATISFGAAQHIHCDAQFAEVMKGRSLAHATQIFRVMQHFGLERFGGPVFVHYKFLPEEPPMAGRWGMSKEEWEESGRAFGRALQASTAY